MSPVIKALTLLFLVVIVVPHCFLLFDVLFGTHTTCTIFGWHDGKGAGYVHYSSSIQATGVCSKCGKQVTLDSQGNWF